LPKPRAKRSPFSDKVPKTDRKVEVLYFVTPKGKCPAEDDFLNKPKLVPGTKKAQLAALIMRYSREGEIINNKRCHRLKGRVRDFWVFKHFQHRLYFFQDGIGRIVITHGWVKKDDELEPQEEDRMLSMRDTYNDLTLYK
jgi:hypothetical protein